METDVDLWDFLSARMGFNICQQFFHVGKLLHNSQIENRNQAIMIQIIGRAGVLLPLCEIKSK